MNNYIRIEKENATFQEVLALRDNRTKRTQNNKFFVEGVQSIKDAINNNWTIDCFLFTKFEKLSDWSREIINKIACKKFELSTELMNKLSDKNDKSEIIAIINKKINTILFDKSEQNPLFLLIDRPSKKENLGNIIRSADAFAVNTIYFTGHSVDIFDPVVIRSSMGSFFKMNIVNLASQQDILNLKSELNKTYPNVQFVATSLQSDKAISEIDFESPSVIMIGNEKEGLNKFLMSLANTSAKIQMRPGIDSLNIASATAIFLHTASLSRIK